MLFYRHQNIVLSFSKIRIIQTAFSTMFITLYRKFNSKSSDISIGHCDPLTYCIRPKSFIIEIYRACRFKPSYEYFVLKGGTGQNPPPAKTPLLQKSPSSQNPPQTKNPLRQKKSCPPPSSSPPLLPLLSNEYYESYKPTTLINCKLPNLLLLYR